jgi:hypothetical protein
MRTITIILFCAAAYCAAAQKTEEPKTLFGSGKSHIGYFVMPQCNFSEIAGSTAVLPGIGAGILLNNKISLGVNYKFIATENTPVGITDTRLYLDQRYTGIKGEYSLFPDKVAHLNFQLEAGIGHTEFDLKDAYQSGAIPVNDVSFAYLEPGAALEINLWKYLKLDLAAGYRLVSDVTFSNLTEKDFKGFTCSAGLKIGIF